MNASHHEGAQVATQARCPYCGSSNTDLFSLFGQQLLTVQLYCNACHTPFEYVKDDDVLEDFATRKEGLS